jgi:hypothetical protein
VTSTGRYGGWAPVMVKVTQVELPQRFITKQIVKRLIAS